MGTSEEYYAGIGARKAPEDVLARMTKLATILYKRGYTLRSGGAEGPDKAFEQGAGKSEIILASQHLPLWTNVFTEYFHPNPRALKTYPWKLMSRNAVQILGLDGDTPVKFVVCYTADGKDSGGTGHAIRIAKYFDIPVFNFYHEDQIEALKGVLL